MTKSEYADLTYFMIYGYKLVKNSENKETLLLGKMIKRLIHSLLLMKSKK